MGGKDLRTMRGENYLIGFRKLFGTKRITCWFPFNSDSWDPVRLLLYFKGYVLYSYLRFKCFSRIRLCIDRVPLTFL